MEQALSKVPSPSREVVRCQQDVYLDSYSLAYRTQAEMWTPRCEEEVVSCFARLRREGRRGSLRGTGYCFDRQSLGDDVSLCLTEMNRIVAVDEVQGTITVQPGVTWGEVVRRLLPTGWMMPVMPTSPKISVGGTLSCNATSRFSPVHGKEGEHVLSFVLITPRGKRLICTRAEQPELFHAVIGGFGFFGAVVEITYQLHHIGARRRIESQIEKFDDLEVLFARLREASRQGDVWDSVSSPVICSPRDRKGMVFLSRFTEKPLGPRYFPHQGKHPLRLPAQWLMQNSWLSQRIWRLGYRFFAPRNKSFVDPFFDYAFFFDAHRQARHVGRFLGMKMPLFQQGFVFPDMEGLRFFQDEIIPALQQRDVWPLLTDVMYLPADAFLTSGNYQREGFSVTLAFSDLRRGRGNKVQEMFGLLTEQAAALGGKLWLTKNVFAQPSTLQRMYADVAPAIGRVKAMVDPDAVLRSAFMEAMFPHAIRTFASSAERETT